MLFFLIGFMACGKTTLGKKVAAENAYTFIDLDEYIVARMQKSIPQIFETLGESEFRKIERASLEEIIEKYAPQSHLKVIVACGGGTPCFFDNHARMQQVGISIYLQENPLILAQRLWQLQDTRPLLQGLSKTELNTFVTELLQKRNSTYMEANKVLVSPSAQILADYIRIF